MQLVQTLVVWTRTIHSRQCKSLIIKGVDSFLLDDPWNQLFLQQVLSKLTSTGNTDSLDWHLMVNLILLALQVIFPLDN